MTVSYAYGYFACSLCTMFKPSACRDRRGPLLSIQEKKNCVEKNKKPSTVQKGRNGAKQTFINRRHSNVKKKNNSIGPVIRDLQIKITVLITSAHLTCCYRKEGRSGRRCWQGCGEETDGTGFISGDTNSCSHYERGFSQNIKIE